MSQVISGVKPYFVFDCYWEGSYIQQPMQVSVLTPKWRQKADWGVTFNTDTAHRSHSVVVPYWTEKYSSIKQKYKRTQDKGLIV